MSAKIRRHPRGGWDVDINVLLATGDRHRERRKLSASYSKTTAREWGERRERELLLTGPKVRKEVPTLEACSALHRRLRASEPPEAERCCGKRVDSAVAPGPRARLTDARHNQQRASAATQVAAA